MAEAVKNRHQTSEPSGRFCVSKVGFDAYYTAAGAPYRKDGSRLNWIA